MLEISNVERRAAVLAQIEKELKLLLPDEGAPAVKTFDDLEAVAAYG